MTLYKNIIKTYISEFFILFNNFRASFFTYLKLLLIAVFITICISIVYCIYKWDLYFNISCVNGGNNNYIFHK